MSSRPAPTPFTGYEPHLIQRHDQRTLSLRGLATMLNVLPADAISLPVIAESLKSNNYYVRYSAAKKLSVRADRESRLLVQSVLASGGATSRASVARHLNGFTWFAVEPLIRQALADEDVRVREAVVYAMCDMRVQEAFELLVEALQDEEDSVLSAATWGLRDCQDFAAVPVLELTLRAHDPEVRVKGLEALGANETPDAIPILRATVENDHDPDVRYAATLSLVEVMGEASLAEIAAALDKNYYSGEHSALEPILRGLFHATNYLKIDLANSKAADTLIDSCERLQTHPSPDVRRAAMWPLAWMSHPRTAALIVRAFENEADPELRASFRRIITSLRPDVGATLH
jgi:HEAT repeat protein